MKSLRFLWYLVAASLLVGCDDDPTEPPTVSISITNCPGDTVYVVPGRSWTRQFVAETEVTSEQPVWRAVSLAVEPRRSFDINGQGWFSFFSDTLDAGGSFLIAVIVDLLPKVADSCLFTIAVMEEPPALLRIGQVEQAEPGEYCEVSIEQASGSRPMGGLELLLGYDARALLFTTVEFGDLVDDDGCAWEYLEYRPVSLPEDCQGPCPTGILRLTAFADKNNGDFHPECYGGHGELLRLRFYVSTDPIYQCAFQPIRFVWGECDDNLIWGVSGDSVFVASRVYDFGWAGISQDSSYILSNDDCDSNWTFRYGGVCDDCDLTDRHEVGYGVIYWNGGIDIDGSD
ncbi:MAG: hypothetical protein ABIJ61_06000 [bacterium]